MNLLTRADIQLFRWLFNKTTGRNCRVIKMISATGDGYVYLIMGLLLWAFEPSDGALFLYTGLLAYAMELPLYLMLKQLFRRQRPADVLNALNVQVKPLDKFSLPSGHSAAAFLMATLVFHFYPVSGVIAYMWAGLIALSRVLLGVHYPGDILAGAVLGIAISILSINMLM
jgi:undecaprenyl-diphosphatase